MKYTIRVTRDPDGEYVDFDVAASTWRAAKRKALAEAKANPHLFGDPPEISYSIRPMDDDEEAAMDPDEAEIVKVRRTLDGAMEWFKDEPSDSTLINLLLVVIQYETDEMLTPAEARVTAETAVARMREIKENNYAEERDTGGPERN